LSRYLLHSSKNTIMVLVQRFGMILIILLLQISGKVSIALFAVETCSVIPAPQEVKSINGQFIVNKRTTIVYDHPNITGLSQAFQNDLKNDYGIDLKSYQFNKSEKGCNRQILLSLRNGYAEEAYSIDIQRNKITCEASTNQGLFYAVQSLRQLIRVENRQIKIPCMLIKDAPRFAWRGFMLDEARHFFGKEVVKQYLDFMSRLKMNRFHWHLSDEQAFRIETKQFPRLSTIGSTGSSSDRKAPAAFYTQSDIKEIIDYAAQRHIMVIPEIDMPGHATAITRSYPYLSGGGDGRWSGFTFHPAKESTYLFIDSLFSEISKLFPSPYIHIGADEVHFGNQSWYTDSIIQQFIRDNDLKNEIGLEHYFIKRVNNIIKVKGKQILAWDEITNVDLGNDIATLMWWRHDKPELLLQSIKKGNKVILTPRLPCYFDFVQDETHEIGRKNFYKVPAINTLQKVYEFPDSLFKDLNISESRRQILGLQASLWTEKIKDKKRLDFLTFPRLLAIAEAGWTRSESKSYQNFIERLKVFIKLLEKKKMYYFNIFDKSLSPEPWGPTKEDVIAEG
jgi:hexosaminidase